MTATSATSLVEQRAIRGFWSRCALTLLVGFAVFSACRAEGRSSPASPAKPDVISGARSGPRPLVLSDEAAAVRLPPVEMRSLSPAEDALISELERIYDGGPRAAQLRKALSDPRVGNVRVTGNPQAQAILDQIAQIRKRRGDSIRIAQRNGPRDVPALLALADRIADSSASAVILRRPKQSPSDVILMPLTKASPSTFGAAIQALVQLRKEFGNVPTQPLQVYVRGSDMPESWKRLGLDQLAALQLDSLKSTPLSNLPGIGAARAMTIHVLAAMP